MLPAPTDVGAKMAIVRVSAKFEVSVDMAATDAASRKVVTIFRENLELLAKPMTR